MNTTRPTPTQRSAAELMREAFAALAVQDLDALERRTWHEDVVEDIIVLGTFRGRAEMRALFAELFAAMPDFEFEVERILDAGENVAVGQWTMRGTLSGEPFRGIEPTGRRIEIRGVDIMEFEDGLLRHNTIYYGLSFARQVGLLPAEGSGADRAMLAAFNALTRVRRRFRGLRERGGRA